MNKFQKFVKKYQYEKLNEPFTTHDVHGDKVKMTHVAYSYPNLTIYAGWCRDCESVWLSIYDSFEQAESYEFADMDGI